MMEKPETIAVRALVGETEAEIEERYGRPMSELQVFVVPENGMAGDGTARRSREGGLRGAGSRFRRRVILQSQGEVDWC